MKEIFLTTSIGFVVGAIFSIFRLPIPAPPMFSGIMGIFGLWVGYATVMRIINV